MHFIRTLRQLGRGHSPAYENPEHMAESRSKAFPRRRPRPIAGMETALPDYSERLARRTGVSARVVDARPFNPRRVGEKNEKDAA